MAFGIYKPGQGYWVRVLTATMLAVLTLGTAAWVYQQGRLVADKLPKSTATLGFRQATGPAPTAGAPITLKGEPDANGEAPVVATITAADYDENNQSLRATGLSTAEAEKVSTARSAQAPGGFAATVANRSFAPAIEPLLLQGISAAVVLLAGFFLTYWLTGSRPATVDFLTATDMEMKKVHWSTRREILGSTWVVIGAALLLAVILFVFDLLLQSFFKLIGVLV